MCEIATTEAADAAPPPAAASARVAASSRVYTDHVLDAHCHVASTRFIPPAFYEGLCRNVIVRLAANGVKRSMGELMEMYAKSSQDHEADGLLAGVSKPQRQWLMSKNAMRLLNLD